MSDLATSTVQLWNSSIMCTVHVGSITWEMRLLFYRPMALFSVDVYAQIKTCRCNTVWYHIFIVLYVAQLFKMTPLIVHDLQCTELRRQQYTVSLSNSVRSTSIYAGTLLIPWSYAPLIVDCLSSYRVANSPSVK